MDIRIFAEWTFDVPGGGHMGSDSLLSGNTDSLSLYYSRTVYVVLGERSIRSNQGHNSYSADRYFSTLTAAVVTGENQHGDPHARGDLIERARSALSVRLAQRRIFPSAVFRESCWDIMLLCFASQLDGHSLCIKQIRNHLDESNTALLRRIDELEQAGMVRRHRDELDARRTTIRLTSAGIAAMTRFFELPAAGR